MTLYKVTAQIDDREKLEIILVDAKSAADAAHEIETNHGFRHVVSVCNVESFSAVYVGQRIDDCGDVEHIVNENGDKKIVSDLKYGGVVSNENGELIFDSCYLIGFVKRQLLVAA